MYNGSRPCLHHGVLAQKFNTRNIANSNDYVRMHMNEKSRVWWIVLIKHNHTGCGEFSSSVGKDIADIMCPHKPGFTFTQTARWCGKESECCHNRQKLSTTCDFFAINIGPCKMITTGTCHEGWQRTMGEVVEV